MPQTGPVRVDPPAELGPTPDQGLVGHLDVTLLVTAVSFLRRPPPASGGDQPGIRQPPDDCLDRRHLTHGVEQLSEGRAPLGVFGPLARLRQPQEDAPADLSLGVVEAWNDLVGPLLQRPLDPTDLLVGRDGQAPPIAPLPQLQQRVLQQRQGPRLARDVAPAASRSALAPVRSRPGRPAARWPGAARPRSSARRAPGRRRGRRPGRGRWRTCRGSQPAWSAARGPGRPRRSRRAAGCR